MLSGCIVEPDVPTFPAGEVEGYIPLYVGDQDAAISFITPQPVRQPGKIYTISGYLLINEKNKGIHVFNNSDPSNPVPVGFLKMFGNTEMAIRGNVLYADHLTDLVALDIKDWNNISELSRLKQEHWYQEFPPTTGVYFTCIDKSKGVVMGWELATLKNPKCYR
jgi:hypothetical protein